MPLMMMMMMMLMMRLDRQVKAHVFCSECGSVTSCQCCKLQLCKASMNPSATNALFVCCLLLVLFFIVGMMLAAVALLSQRARHAAKTSGHLRYRAGMMCA